jgi:hypothetical protein
MATKTMGFGPKLVQSLDQTKKEADSLRTGLSLYRIIAVRRRIDWLSLRIGDGRIEHIARLQRLAEREWIPCIHSIVAKKPVESSVVSFVPDLVTILSAAPLAPPNSAE